MPNQEQRNSGKGRDLLGSDIERFFEYFAKLRKDLDDIDVPHGLLFKCLSCFSMLDTLSRCVGDTKENRKRFLNLIKNFCDWKDGERISVPHLVRYLQIHPSQEFEDLRVFGNQKIDAWKPGNILTIVDDIEVDEVRKRWPRGYDKSEIEDLQHWNLLWQMRNSLVHEIRFRGRGHQGLATGDAPVYHSQTALEPTDDPTETWELVYPFAFLAKLLNTALTNLRAYCERNTLNPYNYYRFGTYWLDELNDVM